MRHAGGEVPHIAGVLGKHDVSEECMDAYYLAYQGRDVVCVVLCDNSDDNLAFENVGPLVGDVSDRNIGRTRILPRQSCASAVHCITSAFDPGPDLLVLTV